MEVDTWYADNWHVDICDIAERKNNIDYMSVRIGMCIFLSNISDSFFKLYFLLYFIYLNSRQTMVIVGKPNVI